MSKAHYRSTKDLRLRLLSSLRRYSASFEALELLNKEQLSFLCSLIGVASPSKKTRNELGLCLITFKTDGLTYGKVNSSVSASDEEIEGLIMLLESVLSSYNDKNGITYSPYKISVLDALPFDFDNEYSSVNMPDKIVKGVVNMVYNRYYIQQGKYGPMYSDPWLPDELFFGLRLRVGFEVTAKVKTIGCSEVVVELIDVNGETPKPRYKDTFVGTVSQKSKRKLDFTLYNEEYGVLLNKITAFRYGYNLGLITKNGCNMSKPIEALANDLRKDHIVYFLDFKTYYDKEPLDERTYALFDKSDDVKFSSLLIAIAKVKNEYVDGNNVFLVIDSMNEVIKLMAKFVERFDKNRKLEATCFIQNILLMSRQGLNKGSVNEIISMDVSSLDSDSRGMFSSIELEELIRKYLNSHILFDATLESFGVYPPINLLKSGNKKGEEVKYLPPYRKLIRKGNYLVETEKAIKALCQKDEIIK